MDPPPQVLASGRGRCRAAGGLADRMGANLPIAAGAVDVGFPPGGGADIAVVRGEMTRRFE